MRRFGEDREVNGVVKYYTPVMEEDVKDLSKSLL
jgi:hypothetical protein